MPRISTEKHLVAANRFSIDVKSIVPYRQRSAGRVLLLPCRLKGAVWIRRFGLNRVGIWQDNCFKGIHCSAAISWRLRQRICGCGDEGGGVHHAICPAKSYTAFSYPRSGFSANRRVTHRESQSLWTRLP